MQAFPLHEREHALGIEREENDGRARDDRAEPLFAGAEHLLVQHALRDVTRVYDHAVRVRLIELRLTDRFEGAPRSVRMLEPERGGLGRPGPLNRVGQRFHDRREVLGVHELERVVVEQLLGAIAEQALHRRAHVPDDAVVAENRDDVGSIFGQGAEMLLALAQRFLDAGALQRGGEHVRERLNEQDVGTAEFTRLRAVGPEHTPGTLASLHDDAHPAHDVVCFEMGRDAEPDLGGEILDDHRAGGSERVAGQRAAVGRDQRSPDRPLGPALARPHQQAAVLRFELENLAELDVEPARQELGRGVEQVDGELPGERLLAEVGDRLLLARRRAQLLLGAVRFRDPKPPKPLRAQPCSVLERRVRKLDARRLASP